MLGENIFFFVINCNYRQVASDETTGHEGRRFLLGIAIDLLSVVCCLGNPWPHPIIILLGVTHVQSPGQCCEQTNLLEYIVHNVMNLNRYKIQ